MRAGIVVTGTEVLSGAISDRNGPWVAAQLLDLGVDVAHILICGDRPEDMTDQLRFLADRGVDLIVTTGGLGPTADDLTVATVARFCDRELYVEPRLAEHIEGIVRRWRKFPDDQPLPDALTAGLRKQAELPAGAHYLDPTGTAPGVVIPTTDELPAILVLPGPPHELQAMWPAALQSRTLTEIVDRAPELAHENIRAYALSEPELAATLREAEQRIPGYGDLEVTTCMRGGELEIDTRFALGDSPAYSSLAALLIERHGERIYSTDGRTIDQLLVDALDGRTIGTAESCTAGLVAARIADLPGSSAYLLGGVVSYANEIKSGVLEVPEALIADLGAVSEPVAAAMADGARARLGVDVAVSTSGIAGPGGAVPGKPVGTVCFGLSIAGRETIALTRHFRGDRAQVRAFATTYALHWVWEALRG